MSETDDIRAIWSKRPLRIAALIPPVAILFLIGRYAVNVPYHDEWDWSVKHVLAGDLTRLDFAKFWNLNNEHRVFVPKLITTALAHMTNLDMRAGIYAKFLFTLAVALVLVSLYRRQRKPSVAGLAPLLMSLCLFNLAQWPRWIDVRPVPSTMSMLGLVGALWFACSGEPNRKRFWGAACCAWVSSSSYFSGNVTWVVTGIALWLYGWNRRACAGWFVLALLVGLQYILDLAKTPNPTSASAPPQLVEIFEFTLIFLGSVCSSAHRGLPNQTEALLYGMLGVLAAGSLVFLVHSRLEDGRRRVCPWLAILLWVPLNAAAAGFGRIPSAGVISARAWRYTVFGGIFWAAIAVLAATLLFETNQKLSRSSRTLALGALTVLCFGLGGGVLGMLQSGGLEAYPRNMQAGRAALLLDERHPSPDLEFLVPSIPRFRDQLPGLVRRKASFLYGEQGLGLATSKRSGSVVFSRRSSRGRQTPVFSIAAGASVAWRATILDRPIAKISFGLASEHPGELAQVSVRVRVDGESTTIFSGTTSSTVGEREILELDLTPWIGRNVAVRFRCESDSDHTLLLVRPRLVYDIGERVVQ